MKLREKEQDCRFSNLTSNSLRRFDEQNAFEAQRQDKNIPLKKNMTHKHLFKDAIEAKENAKLNTPREKVRKDQNEKNIDFYAYPGFKSSE